MNDGVVLERLLIAFAGGIALGVLFFGGLWLTVRYFPRIAGGSLLVILSFVARAAIVLWGMYFLARGDWRAIVACLLGFLVARTVILRKSFTIERILRSPGG